MNETPNDQAAVVAEITADADRQRAESTPAAMDEAEIIAAFEDLAPPGALGDDGAAVIARLGAVSHINVDVPTGSNQAVFVPVKKGLRKMQAWYLRYVTDQVSVAFALTVGALEDHERRIRSSDDHIDPLTVGVDTSPAPSARVIQTVAESITDIVGTLPDGRHRVLSAWCGSGEIIAALTSRGVDAYGVESLSSKVSESLRQGLDTRNDDAADHLSQLPSGSLAGVVFGSTIDLLSVGAAADALDSARNAVCKGGVVVVVADTNPVDPIRFELTGRRPLSTEAWRRLMTARNLGEVASAFSSPDDLTVLVGRC